jgi:hypothetical protein
MRSRRPAQTSLAARMLFSDFQLNDSRLEGNALAL